MEIGDRRLRYEDGKFYSRAICRGKETTKEIWNEMKFGIVSRRYLRCELSINKKRTSFAYHRLIYKLHNPDWDILNSSQNNSIDHINGNKLDNRIENLRLVTHQENGFNRTTAKGYYNNPNGTYQTGIRLNGKSIHLGTYKTEEEAREAYLRGKEKYHVIQSR